MALALAEFSEGDILKFKGLAYNHYAVYIGNDEIIHYQPSFNKKLDGSATIIKQSIQSYWAKAGRNYPEKATLGMVDKHLVVNEYNGSEVVRRAKSKLGRASYNLLLENCEDFVNWCKYGVKMSDEAEKKVLQVATPVAAAGGAATGILIGAAAGSAVPIVGNVVGGVIGGVVGAIAGAVTGRGALWGANKVARKVKAEVTDGDDL